MNVTDFIRKWQGVELSERSAYQQHFLDLCDLIEHPRPSDVDPTGEWFAIEKGTEKQGGGQGWADVWMKGHFAWEYKKKRADLEKAYDQLLRYRESLANPPLLVVCDMDVVEIHTNFTGTKPDVYRLTLDTLDEPRNLEILHSVFHNPEKLKPGQTSEAITAEAARQIGEIAQRLRERGEDAQEVAGFMDRLVFCMFAEDIGLLSKRILSQILENFRSKPDQFRVSVGQLFKAMADGGVFGSDAIRHFNGSLFLQPAVLHLETEEIDRLHDAAQLDWSAVDPSIFGTLFERGLDPDKRQQIGAHYTSREDIETLVEPVVLWPLRREWDEVRDCAEAYLARAEATNDDGSPKYKPETIRRNRERARDQIRNFMLRLTEVKVLDPACGSGNFLYVTLQKLKELEKEIILWAAERGLGTFIPLVQPRQLYGLEINPYAYELAQMSVWIGYLQWLRFNGHGTPDDPILEPLKHNFHNMDAILDTADPHESKEPDWPKADFIVGNPPFLGGKLLRSALSDDYVDQLFDVWDGRVPREADLCCYWFEKARHEVEQGTCRQAGLLATQGIRGGANRRVLQRISDTGEIFFAESDRPWVLDGANVHVSMVGFNAGENDRYVLDGKTVPQIHTNLTAQADITQAQRLPENADIAFMGDTKGGPFDIDEALALEFLNEPNPHGMPNSEVVVPWVNGRDVTRRSRWKWIIDFGVDMAEAEAAKFERPFEYVQEQVKPQRLKNKRESYREHWWRHVEARFGMREAISPLPRFVATPRVTKFRLFTWMENPTLPDSQVIILALSDDELLGVLHSRAHEVWALRMGTRLETRPRYTPTTCFETFPFPDWTDDQRIAIADAARELTKLRGRWLNPPEWTREEVLEFPGSINGPWARFVHDSDDDGIGTVRYPRRVAKDNECAEKLKDRTLTNLYNEWPTWLDQAHRRLDEAVFSAYGWSPEISDDELLERLLALNLERAANRDQ